MGEWVGEYCVFAGDILLWECDCSFLNLLFWIGMSRYSKLEDTLS